MVKAHLLASVAVAAMAFMSEIVETVIVKGDGGEPLRINKSDYDADPKAWKLHGDDKNDAPDVITAGAPVAVAEGLIIPPAPSAPHFIDPAAPATASNDTLFINKEGKLFFIVRADGSKVDDALDVDPKGYKTEAEARAAYDRVKKAPFEQGSSALPEVPAVPEVPPVPPISNA